MRRGEKRWFCITGAILSLPHKKLYNKDMAEDTVFTKIIKGQMPCHRLYEDQQTLAFLDIHPIQPGHSLVVPKTQIEFVWDLPDDIYQAVMSTSKKVALQLRQTLKTKYVSQRIVGVDVPHAHVQLIPFDDVYQLKTEQNMSAEPDHKSLAALAEILRF